MELSKHKNHRNTSYLSWLRKQKCVASGQKAQCAHHIRLGTNGGSSLKPSDYFCIPLLNEYHTTGLFAIHIVGEDTFLKQFKLDIDELFIGYLKQYLAEEHDTNIELKGMDERELIARLIHLIEEKFVRSDKPRNKSKSKKSKGSTVVKKSITDNEFYQKSKEEKKARDRQLRAKLKENEKSVENESKLSPKKKVSKKASSLKENEFYEKAKEQKRLNDKELRQKMKSSSKKTKKSVTQSEFYQKAKELKRIRDKELRAKLKESQKTKKKSVTESDYYQKMKELKRIRDKEFRQKIKEQKKKK